MNLKRLAKLFGVKIYELAEMVGLSRYTLYNISSGNSIYSKNLVETALETLRRISGEMYEKDMQEAEKRKLAREMEISEIEALHKKGVI